MSKLIISVKGIYEFCPLIAKVDGKGMISLNKSEIDKLIANAVNSDYSLL